MKKLYIILFITSLLFSSCQYVYDVIDDVIGDVLGGGEKTGEEGEFNTEELLLELIDITNLEKAIINDKLPETGGFFFGIDSYEYEEDEIKWQKEQDLKFIKEAKEAIMEGDEVLYNSWW